MSTSIEVFADRYSSLDDFARDVAERMALEIRWKPSLERFQFQAGRVFGEIKKHKYESDRDMAFSELPYVVQVQLDDRTFGDNDPYARGFASELFAKLRETGQHRLLMTLDLQQILKEFRPQVH